jgi:hypothetical protein
VLSTVHKSDAPAYCLFFIIEKKNTPPNLTTNGTEISYRVPLIAKFRVHTWIIVRYAKRRSPQKEVHFTIFVNCTKSILPETSHG